MTTVTNRSRRDRACTGKIRYSSRMVAENAATALAWIGRTGLDAYRCPWCDHWHLGRTHKEAT